MSKMIYSLIIVSMMALAVSPVMADEPTYINGSYHHNHSVMEGAIITYYTPSPTPIFIDPQTFSYPSEYYTLGDSVNNNLKEMDHSVTMWSALISGVHAMISETRRQTILMERQNELLAEQNALLKNMSTGRLVCTYYRSLASGCDEFSWVKG